MIILIHARDDFQETALAGSVQSEHADLGSIVEAEIDLAQHLLLRRIDFADVDQRKNDLFIVRGHEIRGSFFDRVVAKLAPYQTLALPHNPSAATPECT